MGFSELASEWPRGRAFPQLGTLVPFDLASRALNTLAAQVISVKSLHKTSHVITAAIRSQTPSSNFTPKWAPFPDCHQLWEVRN